MKVQNTTHASSPHRVRAVGHAMTIHCAKPIRRAKPIHFAKPIGRALAGFTIMEVLVAVVIIGILAAVVAPRLIGRVGDAKTSSAKSAISSLVTAMNQFRLDCGEPESGADLTILWERPANVTETAWKGPYVENQDAFTDPWGKPYELVIPPQHNADFDIVSMGKDGVPGGEGENADIVSGKRDR